VGPGPKFARRRGIAPSEILWKFDRYGCFGNLMRLRRYDPVTKVKMWAC